jgi:hypothetical protein
MALEVHLPLVAGAHLNTSSLLEATAGRVERGESCGEQLVITFLSTLQP